MSMEETMSIEIHPPGGSGETIMSMEETMSIEIYPQRGSGPKRIMSIGKIMSIEIPRTWESARTIMSIGMFKHALAKHVVTILINAPSRDRIGLPPNGPIKLLYLMV